MSFSLLILHVLCFCCRGDKSIVRELHLKVVARKTDLRAAIKKREGILSSDFRSRLESHKFYNFIWWHTKRRRKLFQFFNIKRNKFYLLMKLRLVFLHQHKQKTVYEQQVVGVKVFTEVSVFKLTHLVPLLRPQPTQFHFEIWFILNFFYLFVAFLTRNSVY